MKYTLIAFFLILSFLTPHVNAQTTNANAELIQKLLAQIVILQAELAKLTGTTTPCTFTRTLREGTQGTDVTCLQTYLKKKGHFSGTATGYYGPVTRDAVYKWQQSAGIVPEPTAIGMFGPRSQETLVREMKTPSVMTNTVPATNSAMPTNTMTRKTTKGGGGDTTPKTTDITTPKTNTTTTPLVATVPKINTVITPPPTTIPITTVVVTPAVSNTPTTTVPIVLDFTPQSVQTSVPTPAVSKTPANSLASQIQATAPGRWVKISTDNSADDVDPGKDLTTNSRHPNIPWYHGTSGYKSIWAAWNSGALAPRFGSCGTIVYYGGGHADYFGNAVIGLDLCGGINGAPIWRRLTNPYDPKAAMKWPYPTGAFPDGTPSPAHIADGIGVDPNTNKMIITMSQGCIGQGSSLCGAYPNEYVNSLWVLDLASRTWNGPHQHKGGKYSSSAWDSKRNLLWFQPAIGSGGGGELTTFNPASSVFTYYGNNRAAKLSMLDHVMGYDPINDKLVETNFRSAPYAIGEFDPANPSAPWKEVVQLNKPPSYGAQNVLAWSPQRSAWIIWMDTVKDDKVWEVKRTGVNATGTPLYTWTLLTAPTNTLIPITTSHNGSYEKYQLINIGGSEVLIGQLGPANGVHAFKIPAPGVVTRPTQLPLTSSQTKATLQDLLTQLRALQAELKKLK